MAQKGLAFGSQPAIQNGGVDLAEIGFVDDIAIGERGEVGRVTVEASLDPVSEKEDGGGGTVIGAGTAVFRDAPPKLAKGEDKNAAGVFLVAQVVAEGADGPMDMAFALEVHRFLKDGPARSRMVRHNDALWVREHPAEDDLAERLGRIFSLQLSRG